MHYLAIPQQKGSPALEARVAIAGDLYRKGRITRAEYFRLAVDAAIGQDSGPIEYETNEDHQFMLTGVGLEHDEYRRREANYQAEQATRYRIQEET